MTIWWDRNKAKLRNLDDRDRRWVEEMTGCIPLFLKPLFQFSGQEFDEEKFLRCAELETVQETSGPSIKERNSQHQKICELPSLTNFFSHLVVSQSLEFDESISLEQETMAQTGYHDSSLIMESCNSRYMSSKLCRERPQAACPTRPSK